VGGVDEAAGGLPRLLVGLGRRIRQEMQPAVDVGVFVRVGVSHRIDDGLRLLGRSAIVEINQWLAVDLTRQDRKSRRIASTS
jgi:hypothetical protein